jgi:hypothetical protein
MSVRVNSAIETKPRSIFRWTEFRALADHLSDEPNQAEEDQHGDQTMPAHPAGQQNSQEYGQKQGHDGLPLACPTRVLGRDAEAAMPKNAGDSWRAKRRGWRSIALVLDRQHQR